MCAVFGRACEIDAYPQAPDFTNLLPHPQADSVSLGPSQINSSQFILFFLTLPLERPEGGFPR